MTLFWLPDYANASLRVQARMDLKLKFTLNVLKCKLKRFETQNNITGKKKSFFNESFFLWSKQDNNISIFSICNAFLVCAKLHFRLS